MYVAVQVWPGVAEHRVVQPPERRVGCGAGARDRLTQQREVEQERGALGAAGNTQAGTGCCRSRPGLFSCGAAWLGWRDARRILRGRSLGKGHAVLSLSFDLEHPPQEPPAECVDALTWRLAYTLHTSHRPDVDGICSCGHAYPCSSARLAGRGFRVSCRPAAEVSMADPEGQRVLRGVSRRRRLLPVPPGNRYRARRHGVTIG
jgi:hypothetical protein